LSLLISSLIKYKLVDEAIFIAQSSIKIKEISNTKIHLLLAFALIHKESFIDAKQSVKSYLDILQNDPASLLFKAYLSMKLKSFKEAE